MTTFNTAFDWDTNLPPSISSLDENDFLLLLQKQFPSANVDPITPSVLSKTQVTVGTNPQSLTKFSLPNTSSPLSTDSSPSPPSANDEGSANGSTDGINRSDSTRSADDEQHKRKASADDFDDELGGQPSSKSQHTDNKSKKSSNVRRKSGGAERGQDESRLLKRKEQNRAAQRAFRERKEKHVKDLEDKVAQLETKTETQATENDNLRDMLSRLQNENMMLKQTAFTFSVPGSSSPKTATQERTKEGSGTTSDTLTLFNSKRSVPGPNSVPASAGSSVASASTHDSPSSLFEGFEGFKRPGSDHPTNTFTTSSTPATAAATPSSSDVDSIAFFGSPGPFTTLASNPMYTSYRDPIQSMNAFASFGGWDGDITMGGTSSSNNNANAGLEDLFGDQFSGLVPFSSDFLDANPSPSASSGTSGLSPVGHNSNKGASPSASTQQHTDCPKNKGDIERMVASGEKSTFGSPPVVEGPGAIHGTPSPGSGPMLTPARHGSGEIDYDAVFRQALGHEPKKEYNNDSCNIDELCLEMQRKAKCTYDASAGSL